MTSLKMNLGKWLILTLALQNCVAVLQNLVQFLETSNASNVKQAYFTKTFLNVYKNYSLMFHVENQTLDNVDHLLQLVNRDMFGNIIVINQDTLNSIDFQQRKGSSYLHLIVLKDMEKFDKYLEMPGCLISTDTVGYILLKNKKSLKEKFWKHPRLSWAGNIIILSILESSISIYKVCYYCGNFTGKLHHLQTGASTKLEVDKYELLPRNFSNFRQHRFKVGYVESFPFLLCQYSQDIREDEYVFRTCTRACGLEMETLRVLSEKLNFSYWLIEYGYSLDKTDEDINRGGFHKLDLIMGGISITAAIAPKMSFTAPLAFEPFTFLYIPRKPRFSEVLDILKPFKYWLWLSVFAFSTTFAVVLTICLKLLSHNNLTRCQFTTSLKICFKAIIEQTEKVELSNFRTYYSPFMIVIMWWFASLILSTAYKSKMWAISIKSYHVEPSNLEELLQFGYEIVVDAENIDIVEDIFTDSDPLLVEAKRKLVYKNRTCDTLAYALNNKAAMLDEHATLQYHALVRCSDILTRAIYSKLRITRTPLRHTTHSWPLQIGAPYKLAFDTLLGRIDAAGLQTKWKADALAILRNKYDMIPYSQPTAMEKSEDEEEIEERFLQGFTSSFAFYLLGNLLAIIVFVVETVYYKMVLAKNR